MTKRIISLLLVICMVVSLMPMSVLAQEIAISNMVLDCPYVVHEHTEECYDESGSLVCGQVDYVFHEHDDYCYDSDGNLVCLLDEVEEHVHNLNDCYDENSRLVCEYVNVDAHQHNYECFRSKEDEMAVDEISEGVAPINAETINGYIASLRVDKIEDGTGPFDELKGNLVEDESGNMVADVPGCDSGADNKVVRSFDDLGYNLSATFDLIDEAATVDDITLRLQVVMAKDVSEACFDLADTPWITLNDEYFIEYLGENDELLMTQKSDGLYYDANDVQLVGVDLNSIVKSIVKNNTGEEDSYKSSYKFDGVNEKTIVKQRLNGVFSYRLNEDNNSVAGMQIKTNALWISVLAAENGVSFAPEFKVWVEGNPDNYCDTNNTVCEANVVSSEDVDPVIVSAGENYNIQLRENYDWTYKSWFDFSEGISVEEGTHSIKVDEFSEIGDMKVRTILQDLGIDVLNTKTIIEKGEDGEEKEVEIETEDYIDTWQFLEKLAVQDFNYGQSDPSQFYLHKTDTSGIALPEKVKKILENYRYGRMGGYAATLQLYGREGNGMKGLSLPKGEISFDLSFTSDVVPMGKTADSLTEEEKQYVETNFTPILWDYNENVRSKNDYTKYAHYKDREIEGKVLDGTNTKGFLGRNFWWTTNSDFGIYVSPANYYFIDMVRDKDRYGCYYGGDWSYKGMGNGTPEVPTPVNVTGTGEDTTYTFSVNDYDFDFNDYRFPIANIGQEKNEAYMDQAKCFSVGYFQVLSVFPRVQAETVNYNMTTVANNLKVTSRNGDVLQADENDTGIGFEDGTVVYDIAHEMNTTDNHKKVAIELYEPGNMTRANSFNQIYINNNPDRPSTSVSDAYLGTKCWGDISYDCSAFAGDDIAIIGLGGLSNNSDFRIKSLNILQLFESRAFSINKVDEADRETTWETDNAQEDAAVSIWLDNVDDSFGSINYLYAVDPDHPEGYDTNPDPENSKDTGDLEYMNTVREEDLVYYDKLADIPEGYTCVGVLAEIRETDAKCNFYLKIQVHVNGEDTNLLGRTAATVNTVRIWGHEDPDNTDFSKHVSWFESKDISNAKLANWSEGSKNSVDGYKKTNTNSYKAVDSETGLFARELCNDGGSGGEVYEKTWYSEDMLSFTPHTGVIYGNSLHILNYKTRVEIDNVKNKKTEGNSYELDYVDDRNVLYTVRPQIQASQQNNKVGPVLTELTMKVVLDKEPKGTEPRVQIDGNKYMIWSPKTVNIVVNEEGDEEETLGKYIQMSTDSEEPTTALIGYNGGTHEIYAYATIGEDGKDITFHYLNVPVDSFPPNVLFQAKLNPHAEFDNIDKITSTATIESTGDRRAYNTVFGKVDETNYNIVRQSATAISKSVDTSKIELDGSINYTVKYSNNSEDIVNSIYLYDILPYSGDENSSFYQGSISLTDLSLDISGIPTNENIYYSTVDPKELAKKDLFCSNNSDEIEDMLNGPLFQEYTSETLSTETNPVTCVYATIDSLNPKKTAKLNISVKTLGNETDDIYYNSAYSWIKGSDKSLKSNVVKTEVLTRSISGLAWYDANLNGLKDKDEVLLSGVKATLFVENDSGKYIQCKENIRKEPISVVTTGDEGEYRFDELPAGNYVVAFSGDILNKFISSTHHKINGEDSAKDSINNDSVPASFIIDKVIAGHGYQYKIDYLEEAVMDNKDSYKYVIRNRDDKLYIELHTIEDIIVNNLPISDNVEEVNNQDLGLIAEDRFPITGGSGVIPFIFGGALLMIASMVAGLIIFSTKKKQIIK